MIVIVILVASEVDSRSLSLNLSFPSLNNKAHMHMHWPESDATCIYTVDAWCSGAIRLNQSATASACAVLLCSDHHRIDSFCSRGRGLGGQVTIGLGPAGCCCSMMATYRRVEMLLIINQSGLEWKDASPSTACLCIALHCIALHCIALLGSSSRWIDRASELRDGWMDRQLQRQRQRHPPAVGGSWPSNWKVARIDETWHGPCAWPAW
jgi:hypothetical protein